MNLVPDLTDIPSTLMGQFMEALNSQTNLDDLNLNIDSLQGGLECNVDEVIEVQIRCKIKRIRRFIIFFVYLFSAHTTRIEHWWITRYQYTNINSIHWISSESKRESINWYEFKSKQWCDENTQCSNVHAIRKCYFTIVGALVK